MGKKEIAEKPAVDLANYAGVGMEDADSDSFAIPFLAILQSGSPQTKKSDPAHIDGAEEGMFMDTVSGELFTELSVVPVYFKREFLEWVPREQGGGFRGKHDVGSEPTYNIDEQGRWMLENGNELKDTRQHYVLYKTKAGTWNPALISMGSTQIKKSRKWMTIIGGMRGQTPTGAEYILPSFATVYRYTSVAESNDKGTWMGWDLGTYEINKDNAVLMQAIDFHKSVTAGNVKVDQDAGADVEADDDVPF